MGGLMYILVMRDIGFRRYALIHSREFTYSNKNAKKEQNKLNARIAEIKNTSNKLRSS